MTNDPEAAIGARVRKLRSVLGMTQRDLALALRERGWAIDPTGITRLEQGERALQVKQLYLLAAVLEAPVGSLLPGSPDDAGRLHRELRRAFAEARESVVQSLYVLDRFRLMLDEWNADGSIAPSFEDALEMIADEVGSDAIALADSESLTAEQRAAMYQALVDRVFANVAVVSDENEPAL